MKYTLPFIFLLSFFVIPSTKSLGQEQQLDSLKAALDTSAEDTSRVQILNAIADRLYRTAPSDAIVYSNLARMLAERLNYQPGLAYAYKNLGIAHYIKGEYIEVLDNWLKSLEIFESIDHKLGISNLTNNIGAVYFSQGDDPKALEYYLRSLQVSEEIGEKLRIATALVNIGTVYLNKPETHDRALEYYSRALPLSEELGDHEAIATSAVNLGELYLAKEETDSARFYFNKALAAYRITGGNISYALINIGKTYAQIGQYGLAISNQKEAYDLAEDKNAKLEMTQSLIALAGTHRLMDDLGSGVSYLKKAESLATEIGSEAELKNIYQELSLTYAELADYKNAYIYHTKFIDTRDVLDNLENDRKIAGLQFSYEIDKKQDEIDILTKDKALQELNLQRQRFFIFVSLAGTLLILIIAFIIYRNYRIKVRTNRMLDKQKDEIENLLLNILPAKVAKELQQDGYATPRDYESVTVLFTDFKSFTRIAEGLTPYELIAELNSYFNAFDNIIDKFNLEKIKTIGDAYMCAGGIPEPNNTHPVDALRVGLAMQEHMRIKNEKRIEQGLTPWELRVGIHTGPIIAGVVGSKKYAYDIWGDTVNIASRMESNGEPGRVNISQSTYDLVKDRFDCLYRGKIAAKNKGEIDMYFVKNEIKTIPVESNTIKPFGKL